MRRSDHSFSLEDAVGKARLLAQMDDSERGIHLSKLVRSKQLCSLVRELNGLHALPPYRNLAEAAFQCIGLDHGG
jgi:hypothetical protein